MIELIGQVTPDERPGCYARIMSTLRAVDISDAIQQAAVDGAKTACDVAVASADKTCRARRTVFTVARAAAKFKRALLIAVRVCTPDGRALNVAVPLLGSVGLLRAAVAQDAEVAASTVDLFATGGDGEALRDNQRVVKALGRAKSATVFMLTKDACWTCSACSCANTRNVEACTDCRLQRPSTTRQVRALVAAAEAGDMAAVSRLIEAAIPVNSNCRPLIRASANGHPLLAAGADTATQGHDGDTALIHASKNGHQEVVQALLAAGADIAAQDHRGDTTLILSSGKGHLQVVEALLAAGADIAAQGHYALIHASGNGHLQVVEVLLAAGADTTAQGTEHLNQKGDTALISASHTGHPQVVQALLAAGADTATQGEDGDTALICASREGHRQVVEALLAAGADTATQGEDGDTALICASREGHQQVVEALLAAGADAAARNQKGDTALVQARALLVVGKRGPICRRGCHQQAVVQALLAAQAGPTPQNHRRGGTKYARQARTPAAPVPGGFNFMCVGCGGVWGGCYCQ
jgi:ankyrin repeat protein